MVTPLMTNSVNRRGEIRRNNNLKYTPIGMTVVSPMEHMSPMNTRMTPIRKSLFQRRRITSSKRRKDSFVPHVEEDCRDDSSEFESLKSANRKKDGHLKALQDRFSHIQKGLGSIDEERNQLVEKAKRLDKEKKLIQKQLELREREILTLIKRCASQEEKMRETSKLRANNRDLHKTLDLMATKLKVIEEDTQDRQSLQKLLQDSELDREQLRDRLTKVQREHDAVADTLQECLGNIRKLTEEKNAIEEERRSERKRATMELEKQHLSHVNDSNSLKQSIEEHKSRILEMESILQDKIKSNTDLRREKALMSQGQHEEINEVVEKYEQQLTQLRNEMTETMEQKNRDQQSTTRDVEHVNFMKEKLRSKDEQIREIEKEFSDQMVTLMSKQSSLNEAEEERKNLKLKVESAKKLEIEHAALLDFVEILDSNLVELTSTNAYLELEKDELREETDELRTKANTLQQLCSSLQNNQKAKESDFRELLNAEKDEIRTELQESLRKSKLEIVSLQAELEKRNERISILEVDLQQARKVISDKEREITRIVKQMESLRSTLGTDLRRARLQAAQFEAEVFAKNQTLASLEGRLEGAKAVREVSNSTGEDGTSTGNQQAEIDSLKNETQSLNEQMNATKKDSKNPRDLERTIQEVRNEAMFLQQKIESLSKEKAIIEQEVEKSRSLINDRDEQIVEVQHMVLKHKKRALELERKLQETTKELMDYREKLRTNEFENAEFAAVSSVNPLKSHVELERRIRDLQKELFEAKLSHSESISNLGEAHKRIEILEEQLTGQNAPVVSLENQLHNATNDLLQEQSKVFNTENEYHSTTLLQTEREAYNEKTRSRISFLEQTIKKMKKESNDLSIKVQESRRENADKDEMVSSLKVELVEGQAETKELRSELEIKCTQMEKLELLLCEKDKKVELQMKTTNVSLKSKEERIVELEKIISTNDNKSKNLQDSLSKAKDNIARLEDRIRCELDERMNAEEKMKYFNSNHANTSAPDNDFLPSSDTNALKQKIHALLTRQADLSTELDKTNAKLELERNTWIAEEQNSYKELSIYKAKLLVLQNVLIERERVVSSLQNGDNQNLIAEKRLSDQEETISELKNELQSKAKKIDDLKRQFMNKKEDGIQYAFVESDKRRLEIEDELAYILEKFKKLEASAIANEQQLEEVEEDLERSQFEVAEKNRNILSAENRCKLLEETVESLNGELRRGNGELLKLKKDFKSMKTELREKEKAIKKFNASTLTLKEVANTACNEVNRKNDMVSNLTKAADNLKIDLEKARSEISSKDETIDSLQNGLKDEKTSRLKLEDEMSATKAYMGESEKIKKALIKQIEEKKGGESATGENLLEAQKALEALNQSSSEHIARLESQISKMTSDLTRKDIEIRDLRFQGLSMKKDAERTPETEALVSQIESLKSELRSADNDKNSLRKVVESLQSSKMELEVELENLVGGINERDLSIEELKQELLQRRHNETEVFKQRDAAQKAELEARDQIEEMKFEYEHVTARDNELMNIRLQNKDALHKEEREKAQSELESTLKKLQDSERLLAERGSRLGEILGHNRNIELELERVETKRHSMEEKFAKEQNNFQTTRADLKKVQAELRRKESALLSQLKEERNQRENAEESLRISKNKYKEALKTRRNVTDLERENGELKDKIRRQEAYLQRKLEKDKMDRARLTPSKVAGSPSRRLPRTPDKTTPTQRSTKSTSKELSQSSIKSRSRFQAPSSISRGVSSRMPPTHRNRLKISPTAASTRSARSTRSVFSRSTQLQSPSNQVSPLSAQDILQSELDDDRSVSSELSSILRSPNAKSPGAKATNWELEPRE